MRAAAALTRLQPLSAPIPAEDPSSAGSAGDTAAPVDVEGRPGGMR